MLVYKSEFIELFFCFLLVKIRVTAKCTKNAVRSFIEVNNKRYKARAEMILNIVELNSANDSVISNKGFTSDDINRDENNPVKAYVDSIEEHSIIIMAVQNSCERNYNWVKFLPTGSVADGIRTQIHTNFLSSYAILCKGGCPGNFLGKYNTSTEKLNKFRLQISIGKFIF